MSESVSPKTEGDEAFELGELYGETDITKDVPRVGSVPRQRRRAEVGYGENERRAKCEAVVTSYRQ